MAGSSKPGWLHWYFSKKNVTLQDPTNYKKGRIAWRKNTGGILEVLATKLLPCSSLCRNLAMDHPHLSWYTQNQHGARPVVRIPNPPPCFEIFQPLQRVVLSGRYCPLPWNVVGTLLCALVEKSTKLLQFFSCFQMAHMKSECIEAYCVMPRHKCCEHEAYYTHTHKLQESVNGWLVVKVGDFFFPAGSEIPSSVGKNEGFQFPVIPTENQYKAEIQGLRYKTLTRLIPFLFCSGDGGVLL